MVIVTIKNCVSAASAHSKTICCFFPIYEGNIYLFFVGYQYVHNILYFWKKSLWFIKFRHAGLGQLFRTIDAKLAAWKVVNHKTYNLCNLTKMCHFILKEKQKQQ